MTWENLDTSDTSEVARFRIRGGYLYKITSYELQVDLSVASVPIKRTLVAQSVVYVPDKEK